MKYFQILTHISTNFNPLPLLSKILSFNSKKKACGKIDKSYKCIIQHHHYKWLKRSKNYTQHFYLKFSQVRTWQVTCSEFAYQINSKNQNIISLYIKTSHKKKINIKILTTCSTAIIGHFPFNVKKKLVSSTSQISDLRSQFCQQTNRLQPFIDTRVL